MPVAPDGSQVRILARPPAGRMAYFELGPGEASSAIRHRTVSELWYVTQGLGQMWRHQDDGEPRMIDLRAGIALTIPVATSLQFRNTAREPLAAVGVTMPPWPGEGEAMTAGRSPRVLGLRVVLHDAALTDGAIGDVVGFHVQGFTAVEEGATAQVTLEGAR